MYNFVHAAQRRDIAYTDAARKELFLDRDIWSSCKQNALGEQSWTRICSGFPEVCAWNTWTT